jgi:MFS family permease
VAHLTTSATRSDIYAWYSLMGTAGTAFGMMICGWAIHYLASNLHWELVDTYRVVFLGYAALGCVKFVLAVLLSNKVESDKKTGKKSAGRPGETTPLLSDGDGNGNGAAAGDVNDGSEQAPKRPTGLSALLPEISRESRLIMVNLCILFALDAFASGLAPL